MVNRRAAVSNEEFLLEQSQILVLYTDGITEARKEDELFGSERLLSLVSSIETNTRGFSQEILSGVSAFTDGPPSDDLAVLTVSLSDA